MGTVFGNTIFRNIVLSLSATYGLYIISSLLALEPWHMGGSSIRAGVTPADVSHVFLAVYTAGPKLHQRLEVCYRCSRNHPADFVACMPSRMCTTWSVSVLVLVAIIHVQSWGTKGSDKVSDDLGVVKSSGANKNEVTVDVPGEQKDINEVYEAELQVLARKPGKEVKVVNDDQKQEDYYKVSRGILLECARTSCFPDCRTRHRRPC